MWARVILKKGISGNRESLLLLKDSSPHLILQFNILNCTQCLLNSGNLLLSSAYLWGPVNLTIHLFSSRATDYLDGQVKFTLFLVHSETFGILITRENIVKEGL